MKKIPTVFERNFNGDKLVRNQVVEGCGWILEGLGYATEKMDGTACLIKGGRLFKRYTLRQGKAQPAEFESVTRVDEVTGKQEGWVPCYPDNPDDQWHFEGLKNLMIKADGTYELVGPKVQGNPLGFPEHKLVKHGEKIISDFPRDFEGMRNALVELPIEGVVFHHHNGQMAKIKRRDFGLPWPLPEGE